MCQGYKQPDHIDPKFLDPKFALEEVEDELDSAKQITSLKKLLETSRNRSGYADNLVVYQETDFYDFLECQDPYQYLSTYHKVSSISLSKTFLYSSE